MGEEVKLLGTWGSPFSSRVIWALKIKGIAYEYVEEDLSNKSALLLQYNPVQKQIPVLVHAGKPICESMNIVEYIEEMWPHTPLLPTDPYDRAIARFWVKFAEDKGSAVWSMFYGRGEEVEKAIKASLEMLETVEEHGLANNGEKIGMVDIAFGSILYWLGPIENTIGVKLFEPHKFPRLHKWFQSFLEVPEIKENIPDRDELLAAIMGEEVKLLGTWGSAFSSRVIWALKLKGIAYEYVEEDLSNKSALLLQYNPVHKKIPVLVHAGKPICESMNIVEYIEEMWPHTPLLPTDPYDRAIARFWVKFVEDKGSALWSMFYGRGEEVEKAMKASLEMLETVEEHGLANNGEKIGMVDIAYGSVLYWLGPIEETIGVKLFEPHKFPRLHKWFQSFLEVPEIKENIPDRDKMVVFFKRYHENLHASH
ncbi:hypothetical protein Ddye_019047 [Dipteronia dyeriana]|uniref:glutathione transferase n=1 Tax=Dipteronia dyeriana TaxID=168575 RepID=A0AAD9TXD3_9ROSI|nr:hypothetical protein Ddye_019047 [Dipteronia dyeriana]